MKLGHFMLKKFSFSYSSDSIHYTNPVEFQAKIFTANDFIINLIEIALEF